MLHKPAVIHEEDYASKRKEKLGVKLFFIYLIIYGGFVAIGLINPDLMGANILGKQNVAIIYGIGLIVLAIVMGFIYNYKCTKMEDEMNTKKEEKYNDL